MRTNFSKLFYLLTTGALILAACNMPGNIAPTETAVPTKQPTINVAATVESAGTQTKQAEPTGTPTEIATETLTPKPSATATPEPPIAEVVRETNCRTGPAGNYELVAKYQIGQKLEVVANDLGAGYQFVQNPDKPEEQCYLLTQNIKITTGDASILPKFTPLASPTAAPYFKASFKKFDKCEGKDYANFIVENAGSAPFRSVYIKVTDLKVNKSVEQALNAFDQRVGCVLAKNIAPLNSGATGYVASPGFEWGGARGHKLRANIMACTEKDLKGTCVTQSVDINP